MEKHGVDHDSLELDNEKRLAVVAFRPGLNAEDAEWLDNVPVEEQRRIYNKVDKRLVPMLALLYLIAHLDRANIGMLDRRNPVDMRQASCRR